jgi:hypothetical protein
MFKWRRVGGTPAQVVFSWVFSVIGAVATLGVGYVLVSTSGTAWSTAILLELFLAAWTVSTFRLGQVGVFISEAGVRNRTMWRTQTIAWPDIKRFETRPTTRDTGNNSFAGSLPAHAVWILLKDSSALQTSLVFRHKSSFLPAKGMDKFGDAISGSAFTAGEMTGTTLTDEVAQQALRELRAAQKEWTR